MLSVTLSPQLEKDIKRLKKKHRDMSALKKVINLLANKKRIPTKYKDHALCGNWQGCRELHVSWQPDWLLIYEIANGELLLLRSGSHDELFK